jgi:hypothetical protein
MRKPASLILLLVPAICTLTVSGCAKRGSPPGGPADNTPPFVSEITPQSGSVGVSLDSPVSVQFSERMKKRTVETGMVVSPPCRWEKRYWQKNAYVMVPEGGLRSSTTYLVSVSNKVEDIHGVAMKSTFVAGFSTGDSIDAGIISGEVVWKRMTVEAAVVELFESDAIDSVEGWPAAEPLHLTLSGAKGIYEIPFVDTEGRYRVLAFLDKNMDASYDEGEEVGCYGGDVVFAAEQQMEGIDITLCGESFTGTLEGRVDTSTVVDTLRVTVLAKSVTDSAVVYKTSPATGGAFRLECVMPGRYVVEGFYDLNANLAKDGEDTFFVELPETLSVESCAEPAYVEISFDCED